MNEVSYIVDATLQPQDCFEIRILMSNLRSPLMKVISTPLSRVEKSRPYCVLLNQNIDTRYIKRGRNNSIQYGNYASILKLPRI